MLVTHKWQWIIDMEKNMKILKVIYDVIFSLCVSWMYSRTWTKSQFAYYKALLKPYQLFVFRILYIVLSLHHFKTTIDSALM